MKRVEITGWDDLDYTSDGTLTRADITVSFSWFGQDYELDLTQAHYAGMYAQLKPYLDAAGHANATASGTSGLKTRSWEHGRDWGKDIRKFARERNLRYLTPSGKFYYSRELRDAYAKFLGLEDKAL